MQAITTKYLGPTNHNGSRILAKCQAGRLTVPYEYGARDPHDVAAMALIRKLGWHEHGEWIGGGLPDGTGNAYVCRTRHDAPLSLAK